MTAAKPLIGGALDDADEALEDNAEWTSVVALGDYVGQSAIGVDLSEVVVRSGRWSGVTLERFVTSNVVFDNVDLSGLVLRDDSSLRRMLVQGCRLTGAVLAGTRMRDVSFVDCTFGDASLRMIDAENVEFERCALVGVDFYAAKIAKARFVECDMRGAVLSKATLSDVDFRTSRLEDIVGADALRGATVGATQVIPLATSLAAALELRVVDD